VIFLNVDKTIRKHFLTIPSSAAKTQELAHQLKEKVIGESSESSGISPEEQAVLAQEAADQKRRLDAHLFESSVGMAPQKCHSDCESPNILVDPKGTPEGIYRAYMGKVEPSREGFSTKIFSKTYSIQCLSNSFFRCEQVTLRTSFFRQGGYPCHPPLLMPGT
jgi:hypothetical protein